MWTKFHKHCSFFYNTRDRRWTGQTDVQIEQKPHCFCSVIERFTCTINDVLFTYRKSYKCLSEP
jgi:hypothetical protein